MFEDEFDVNYLKTQLATQCRDFIDVVTDGEFDIIKSHYNDNPLIIFVIPTIITQKESNLFLGITYANGEYKFNFKFDDTQYI